MFEIEIDYTYLKELETNDITEAKSIADKYNCRLYQDCKLIYMPNEEVTQ